MSDWTLFSNHGHVLVCLARDPQARLRDVAASVGITERAVQKIVRDLQLGGMISVSKQGRRNQYRIHRKVALRHSLESESSIGRLLDLLNGNGQSAATTRSEVSIKSLVQKPVVTKPGVQKTAVTKPVVDESVEKLKSSKRAEPQSKAAPAAEKSKSDIEKQQGSLF